MLLFYAEKITSRLKYTSRLILSQLLGQQVRYTTDKEEYIQSTLPKINYSKTPIQSGIYIQSANLLFETDIFEQDFSTAYHESTPIFFLSGKQSNLPLDPFAASFYLLTRYEEYLPYIADEHGRFPARESLLFKLGKLHVPVVNVYARWIGALLKKYYTQVDIKEPTYSFLNSIDVDNAYAYRGKGLFRAVGSYARDVLAFNFDEIKTRTQVIFGRKPDPFETFDYQLQLQEKYGYNTIYFALFARLGQFDRSLTMFSPLLHRYLKGINDFCEVGIHPSYRSNEHISYLQEELEGLERILRIDVVKSRQHFLKLVFPKTYRNLMEMEITEDYSMGFASETGFRAGICTPFRFYDLEQEIETPLTIYPFAVMDGTFIYYKKMGPKESLEEIKKYIDTYREFGGLFIPVWHNRVLSEKEPEWKGWNEVFEEMIKYAI